MVDAALALLVIFAVTIIGMCVTAIASPPTLLNFAANVIESRRGMWIAVSVRLVAGAAFIIAADASRFPTLFLVIGALSLVAAASLPIIGHQRFIALVDWFSHAPVSVIRVWGVLGAAFGALILYGSV